MQKRGQVLHFSVITGKMGQSDTHFTFCFSLHFSPFLSLLLFASLLLKEKFFCRFIMYPLSYIQNPVFLGPFHLYCRYYMYFSEVSCTSAEAGHRPYSMKFFKSCKQLSCCGWKVLCALGIPDAVLQILMVLKVCASTIIVMFEDTLFFIEIQVSRKVTLHFTEECLKNELH